MAKNLFRTLFVVFIAYIAYIGGQNLDKFVSFVGCFACIPLVYMYPPILHLKSCCKIHSGLLERKRIIVLVKSCQLCVTCHWSDLICLHNL